MQSELKNKERLVPLRRFAREDLYSSSYLSLLVQRKKLKAKRIGRNFYTTQQWFEDYLRKHAKDEIREKYEILFEESQKSKVKSKTEGDSTTFSSGFLFVKKIFSTRTIAMILAFIVILLLISQFNLMRDKGRIAGEEEAGGVSESYEVEGAKVKFGQ